MAARRRATGSTLISVMLLALLALVVEVSGSAGLAGFICPTKDIAETGCKGPKDCVYPNPDDCTSYIECSVDSNNKTGTPVVIPCAPAIPPLEWNDRKKECDYAPSPTCQSIVVEDDANGDVTVDEDGEITSVEVIGTNVEESGPKPDMGFVCPTKDIAKTGCKGPEDCLYPNPDDCNSYIQCSVNADNKTGTPVVMPCAPGNPPYEWNDNKKECDYAPSPTCRSVVVEEDANGHVNVNIDGTNING